MEPEVYVEQNDPTFSEMHEALHNLSRTGGDTGELQSWFCVLGKAYSDMIAKDREVREAQEDLWYATQEYLDEKKAYLALLEAFKTT